MPRQNIFQWKDGRGWLVFASGGALRPTALERMSADGGVAVLSLGDEIAADDILTDLQELGAPAGYMVDVLTEDDDTLRQRIGEAGLVVASSDASPRSIRSGLMGAAVEGLEAAYERGAVLLFEGQVGAVFGAYIVDEDATIPGLEWVQPAAFVPYMTSAADSPVARTIIVQQADAVVVGVGSGAGFVLAGDGTMETWGNKQITIALGSAYTDNET